MLQGDDGATTEAVHGGAVDALLPRPHHRDHLARRQFSLIPSG
jgi:hypothetical protein